MEINKDLSEQNKGGRPSKYLPAYNLQAYKLCLLGATDKELADFFEIHIDTLHTWKREYPRFSDSLRRGKIVADSNVAASLYKRAIGYKFTETTFEKIDTKERLEETADKSVMTDTYKKKIVVKQLPGDVGAQTMWLKNRAKEIWRDKQIVEIDFDRLTDEQIDDLLNKAVDKISKSKTE